jgi:hypothetical protein
VSTNPGQSQPQTYNTTWLIERHGFLTPAQFRQKQLQTPAVAA